MKLENKVKKEAIFLISIVLVIFLLNSISAYQWLCLQKGQTLKFSLCNPAMQDKTCSCTSSSCTCQYCVNKISTSIYCPASLNNCNLVSGDCTYLPATPNQTTTSPFNITLISPVNGYSTYDSITKFSYSMTNSSNAVTCSLLINGVAVATNSSKINSSTNVISKSLTPGNYSWSIKCTNKAGNSSTSLSRNITILSNISTITLISPLDSYTTTLSPIIIQFSYTATNSDNLESCSLFLNGNSVATNSTKITSSTNTISKQITTGVYTWLIKCTDKTNTIITSTSRNLIVLQNQTNTTNQISNNQTNSTNSSITNSTNNTSVQNNSNSGSISTQSTETLQTTNSNQNSVSNSPSSSDESATENIGGGFSYCSIKWSCTEWSNCKNSIQARFCSYPSDKCKPETDKPIEKRSCKEIINTDNNRTDANRGERNISISTNGMDFSEEKSKQKILFGITGASIAVLENNNLWIVLIAIGSVVFTLSYYFNTRKNKNNIQVHQRKKFDKNNYRKR